MLAAPATSIQACGPFFPADLLGDRAATLGKLPEGSFAFEVLRLVDKPRWTVLEHADWLYPASSVTQESIEQTWWGDRYAQIEGLRKAGSAAAAYEQGKDLPDEARRYLAGAVAWVQDEEAEADERFRSVLTLPPDQRAHYGVWAQYMLGRVAIEQEQVDAAHVAFKATRDLVAAGSSDPLGLAATSLGDEARLYLDAGDDAAAIALYAEQAAAGSEFGRTSLLWVARDVIRDDARLDRDLRDPLAQRLLTVYLLTRSGELDDLPYSGGTDRTAPIDPAAKIERFLAAVERNGLDRVSGADRLAALAYRGGRYGLASKLAEKDSSGLAWWVRAKLALRAGDVDAATRAYAQAAKAFPADETWGNELQEDVGVFDTTKPQCRVTGEQGTLALARGNFLAAMGYLYNASSLYWADAAWVAERVLTLDELKGFVDLHAPAPQPAKPAGGEESRWGRPEAATSLRALLGRRLLRAERYDEALAYIDDKDLKAKAQSYVAARRATRNGNRIDQAQAWFDAASSARFDGMELLGYELDPDYQIWGGDFSYGYADTDSEKASELPMPMTSKEESARASASAAVPPERFHYRYTAAAFAGRAADLLPQRSQAFAAVLCQATGWVLDRDPAAARKLYQRYLNQGPYVPWAGTFGKECADPDFTSAAKRWHAERFAHFRATVRRFAPWLAGGAVMVLLGMLALVAQRRKAS
jgi:hypothetical protein